MAGGTAPRSPYITKKWRCSPGRRVQSGANYRIGCRVEVPRLGAWLRFSGVVQLRERRQNRHFSHSHANAAKGKRAIFQGHRPPGGPPVRLLRKLSQVAIWKGISWTKKWAK